MMNFEIRKSSVNPFKYWSLKFWKNREGVTAVEFAMIAPVFMSLLFSVFEMGVLMTKVTLLDLAAAEASKQIYIGAAASGTVTPEDLEETICETVSLIDKNCAGNLLLEMTPITDFSSLPNSKAKCVDKSTRVKPLVTVNPGVSDGIVYMRICLTTEIVVPGLGLGFDLVKTETGKTQIVTDIAFSNEPF